MMQIALVFENTSVSSNVGTDVKAEKSYSTREEQPTNAPSPILVTLSGIVIEVRETQPPNT